MFNLFDFQDEDLSFLINETGQSVTVNGIPDKVLITNKSIGEFEQRYIHSPDIINRGSLVEWNANKYLVISEALEKRGGKYKVIMRNCNGEIDFDKVEEVLIGYDELGRPVYEERVTGTERVYGIVDKRSLTITSDAAVNLIDGDFTLTVQDNEFNREKFQLDTQFEMYGENYRVSNFNYTKKGVIEYYIKYYAS
jgi:hypothetical protein